MKRGKGGLREGKKEGRGVDLTLAQPNTASGTWTEGTMVAHHAWGTEGRTDGQTER